MGGDTLLVGLAGLGAKALGDSIQLTYFQVHGSCKRVTTCVFIDIPGSFPLLPRRLFVFIEIPGSFPQF